MNDEDKNSVLFLENFLKKTKGDKIQIKQPNKIIYKDIFEEEEKETNKENKTFKNKDKLKSVKKSNLVKIKKYNIIKESLVFQELDSKKSLVNISNTKDEYNNYLFNNMIKNDKNNSNQQILYTKKIEFIRKKSTINLNELYENKIKNVRNIYMLL
jgi:hypothetical protein